MGLNDIAITWTAVGCVFAPIYFTALVCSCIKMCRDRKRIIEKNRLIRQKREGGSIFEAESSSKRPNIEIVPDHERARQFRPVPRAYKTGFGGQRIQSTDLDDPTARSKGYKGTNVDDGLFKVSRLPKGSNKNNCTAIDSKNCSSLANGHTTTHVTIEHCAENEIPLEPLQVRRCSADVSGTSAVNQDENTHDADDPIEMAGSECSDSLAIATPSDAGSSQANTDTEIICDHSALASDDYLSPNTDRPRSGKHQYQKHRGGFRNQHHAQDRDLDENGYTSVLLDQDAELKGFKVDPVSADSELYGQQHVRNRRISSSLILDEEQKLRKDQEIMMSNLRSKSEDNVRRDSGEGNLFIHEQGRENHAFERSTENTRM